MTPALDFVSPLPPVRTGIADYSLDLLAELEGRCDLRVIHLPEQPIADEVAARYRPVAAERLGEGGRLPLYQMGNNLHHEAVLELALAHPGALTLHDVWLHHLLVERTLARAKIEPYVEALGADHGWLGRAAALPPRWGGYGVAALFALPAHRRLLLGQRGVLVHSDWAAGVLREELGEAWADAHLEVIAMPVPLPAPVTDGATAELRARYRIPVAAPLLGSFGFQTPIKRTASVLRALARPPLDGVYLLIAGEVSETLDLGRQAEELGVAERVRVTGFLPEAEFPLAIAACDLCVNLRYPTAGETSASLLRILAHGRGAVVSDYAQFAELPEGAVVKVPLGDGTAAGRLEEAASLAAVLARLLADPQRLAAMGQAARQLVAEAHAPHRAAARLLDACRRFRTVTPARLPAAGERTRDPGDSAYEPPLPTSLTWGHLPSALEVRGLEPALAPGERRRLEVRLCNRGRVQWLAGERGEGGVVLEVQLLSGEEDLLAGRPWLPLPRDLGPGDEHRFRLDLRRPPGPARLRIEPHVLGAFGFGRLGGASWEADL